MAVSRRSSRARYVVGLLVLASITLVTLDARGSSTLSGVRRDARSVLDPVSHVSREALAPVGNFLTGAAKYGSLKKENNQLRQQIAAQQAASAQAASAESYSSQVLAQEHLPFATNIPGKVTAYVIAQSPSNFDVSIEINKGTADGVAVGYPVVTQAGLVGQVAAASAHNATITVLTDPSFHVGVAVAGQAAPEAQGNGPGETLSVGNLIAPVSAKIGDILTTSGLDIETFPPGIPVGRVSSVTPSKGQVRSDLALAPLISPHQLLVVTVLIYSPQT